MYISLADFDFRCGVRTRGIGGGGGRGAGGTLQYVRGNYKSFKGTNLTVVARIHHTWYLVHIHYPESSECHPCFAMHTIYMHVCMPRA